VSEYACEWACTTSLVWRAESSSCECAEGFYYRAAEEKVNFDTRLEVNRPFRCVDCSVCPLGSFVAPVRVSKPCFSVRLNRSLYMSEALNSDIRCLKKRVLSALKIVLCVFCRRFKWGFSLSFLLLSLSLLEVLNPGFTHMNRLWPR